MSFSMMKPLPSPSEIQEQYPLSASARKQKKQEMTQSGR